MGCDLRIVFRRGYHNFGIYFAPLGLVHFLSPDRQSGIHCLIICGIQLLTPNNLYGNGRRIYSPDIRSVSALEVFTYSRSTNRPLLTYLLTYSPVTLVSQAYGFVVVQNRTAHLFVGSPAVFIVSNIYHCVAADTCSVLLFPMSNLLNNKGLDASYKLIKHLKHSIRIKP